MCCTSLRVFGCCGPPVVLRDKGTGGPQRLGGCQAQAGVFGTEKDCPSSALASVLAASSDRAVALTPGTWLDQSRRWRRAPPPERSGRDPEASPRGLIGAAAYGGRRGAQNRGGALTRRHGAGPSTRAPPRAGSGRRGS